MTGRALARIVLAEAGAVSYVRLQALMYLANLQALRDLGRLLTESPFFVAWHGPECREVTERWYVNTLARVSEKRPLARRMRRWLIQESGRRNGMRRLGKINMPGGWSARDAHASYAGFTSASWVLPVAVRLWVEGLGGRGCP